MFYDGVASAQEPDEYVEIINVGSAAQDLEGFRLVDIADDGPEFLFPTWQLGPDESVRVYTNETHPESGGFSFGRGSAVWNNSEPDTAGLYDPEGSLVSEMSYPPGCGEEDE